MGDRPHGTSPAGSGAGSQGGRPVILGARDPPGRCGPVGRPAVVPGAPGSGPRPAPGMFQPGTPPPGPACAGPADAGPAGAGPVGAGRRPPPAGPAGRLGSSPA